MRNKNKSRKRAARGTVLTIVILLTGSGTLRLVSSASDAVAAGSIKLSVPVAEVGSNDAARQDYRSEAGALLRALQEREAAVTEREQKVSEREQILSRTRKAVETRIDELEDAENQLRATLALASTAAEDDLARLTAVYEGMKPKDAVPLFETMEPEFAAGFLGRMRPEATAGIMAGLSPQKAYSISVILAGRNANAGKEDSDAGKP